MKGKKIIAVLLSTVVLLTACGGQQNNAGNTNTSGDNEVSSDASGETSDEPAAETSDESGLRVALVVNQRFGDQSSVDIIASGVDKAAQEFGFEEIGRAHV